MSSGFIITKFTISSSQIVHVSVPNRSFGGHRESVVSNSSSLSSSLYLAAR